MEPIDGGVKVTSAVGGVVETFEVPFPCIVSVTEEMNQPRLPPLIQILQAGKKPTNPLTLEDLGLSAADVGGQGSGIEAVSNKAPHWPRPCRRRGCSR
jgi:electron transfer flavoprotein beta subunit